MKKSQKNKEVSYPPEGILTPDEVMTSVGLLQFNDGVPTSSTTTKVYDYLDTMRGVDAFLKGMPAASLGALLSGMESLGAEANKDIVYTESFLDSTPLFLTGNTSTIYAFANLDLKKGAVVMDIPAGALGAFNNAWFRHLGDVGAAGPDGGNGGRFIILPPKHDGAVTKDAYPIQSDSYRIWVFLRFPFEGGDPANSIAKAQEIKVYPLGETPDTKYVDVSKQQVNTIHSNDFYFYKELNDVVQYEPLDLFDKETRGLFASIGIEKGKPFAPDARMRAILTDAVAIGNAASRAIVWYPRVSGSVDNMDGIQVYPKTDSNWVLAFLDKNVNFDGKDHHTMNSDARVTFHYPYTAVTPAMAEFHAGQGSDYAMAFLDGDKIAFDGSKTYKLNIPSPVPMEDFWAVTIYDPQTRSQLQTDQPLPTVGSNDNLEMNDDGSYDIYFAPTLKNVPSGYERNWLQTMPGKGWFIILRLYKPTRMWNLRLWQPSEVELQETYHAVVLN